jgi:integrase/recombinase XerC
MPSHLTVRGLPRPAAPIWSTFLDDWDRSLRAANKPQTTRYNYELAVTQFADFLADPRGSHERAKGHPASPALASFLQWQAGDDSDAATDPCDVTRAHVEHFLAWMIETRSAASAVNKYKVLQQFFGYLRDEEEINRHPLDRIPLPKTGEKLVPVVVDDDMAALLSGCKGKGFLDRRDAAMIRLFFDTGGRLAEITNLTVDDVDIHRDVLLIRGKGNKQRAVPFGANSGQALARYLRVRAKHKAADLPWLFLSERGRKRLNVAGVKTMIRRRGAAAGLDGMHAHRLRHTLAHEWQLHGGNESDLMAIMGWTSPEMLRRYGASARAERAQNSHRTLRLGDRI